MYSCAIRSNQLSYRRLTNRHIIASKIFKTNFRGSHHEKCLRRSRHLFSWRDDTSCPRAAPSWGGWSSTNGLPVLAAHTNPALVRRSAQPVYLNVTESKQIKLWSCETAVEVREPIICRCVPLNGLAAVLSWARGSCEINKLARWLGDFTRMSMKKYGRTLFHPTKPATRPELEVKTKTQERFKNSHRS